MRKYTVLVLLCFLVVVPSFVFGCSAPLEPITTPASPESPTPVSMPQSHNLIDATLIISPGGYYDVKFSVDTTTMHNVRVVCSFTSSGSSGSDIEVIVMDDIAYANWIDGHQVDVLYTSSKTTTANIDLSITTSGTYHLVFSNNHSEVSSKHVSTKVELKWTELRHY